MTDQVERAYSVKTGNDRWEHANVGPGQFSTMETPATGHLVEGSPIPPGRFCAISPRSMGSSFGAFRSAILPNANGTHLKQNDGTDYAAIIAGAQNAAGNLEIIGVSVDYDCPQSCELDWGTYPCPPVGYLDEIMRWKFFRSYKANLHGAGAVSLVQNDNVTVYTETDMKPGDPLHIRLNPQTPFDKNDPDNTGNELIGGVTNVADAGTMLITDTKFANARVIQSAKARSAVWLYLG